MNKQKNPPSVTKEALRRLLNLNEEAVSSVKDKLSYCELKESRHIAQKIYDALIVLAEDVYYMDYAVSLLVAGEELENIKNGTRLIREEYSKLITLCSDFITKKDGK